MKSFNRKVIILIIIFVSGSFYSFGQNKFNPKSLTPPINDLSKVNEKVLQKINSANSDLILKNQHRIFKQSTSSKIGIIESRSISEFHIMDSIWAAVANGLGDSASILPVTVLDDSSFIFSTDILIISSGLTELTSARTDNILNFLMMGKPVYLQGEFSCSFKTNLAFSFLVDTLGSSFQAMGDSSGNLAPMNILGPISQNPNQIDTLEFFWWGCYGSGDFRVQPFLEFNGNYYGFIFTPQNHNYGILITTTDQDWVLTSSQHINAQKLMENIIAYLKNPVVNVDDEILNSPNEFVLEQNYPNPFNPGTKIKFTISDLQFTILKVYDVLGNEVATLVNEEKPAGTYEVEFNANNLASGIYFYTLRTQNFRQTKKMILLR